MKTLIRAAQKHYYLFTALLMFLGNPGYDVWFLKGFPFFAWFAFIPLLLYVRDRSMKEVYLSSFITSMAGVVIVYSWIGQFGDKVPGGDIVILSMLVPSLSIFFATKIIAAEYLSRRFGNLRMLIYPSVWIMIDGVQSIGFLAFPWTYWGYTQYPFTAFIQISSFIGIFGITFIMITANALFAEYIHAIRTGNIPIKASFRLTEFRKASAMVVFVLLAVVYGALTLAANRKQSDDRLKVAMVQSCIDPWEDWGSNRFKYLSQLKRLTEGALTEDPEFIIWSESATIELISYDYLKNTMNPFEWEVLNIARENKRPLLTGEVGIIEDEVNRRIYPQNNAVLISEEGEVTETYPKIHLVPFGEWFPYGKWLPFIQNIANSFGASSFFPGSAPHLFKLKGKSFGALICYEGIFFRLCRKYKLMGADYFVNITNLGWTDTYKGHMQGFANAAFRAVENGIWFVSAGNTGYTAFVDPYGRITASIPILKPGYLTGYLDFSLNHATFYSAAGDLVLYAALVFISFLTGVTAYRRFFPQ